MTRAIVREICRFCLALLTVLTLWDVVIVLRSGGTAAFMKGRGRSSCSAGFAAAPAVEPSTTASGRVER